MEEGDFKTSRFIFIFLGEMSLHSHCWLKPRVTVVLQMERLSGIQYVYLSQSNNRDSGDFLTTNMCTAACATVNLSNP